MTLPGEDLPLGTLRPTTLTRRIVEDAFLGLGYEVIDDREVETVHYNFDQLAFLPAHRRARTGTRSSWIVSDSFVRRLRPPRSTSWRRRHRLHGLARPRLPARRGYGHSIPDLPPVRGARRRPESDACGSQGDGCYHVMPAHLRREPRGASRTYFRSPEPSIRPDVSVRSATCRAAGRASSRAGSRWAGPAWWTPRSSRTSASIPRSGRVRVRLWDRAGSAAPATTEIRPFWENDLRVMRQF